MFVAIIFDFVRLFDKYIWHIQDFLLIYVFHENSDLEVFFFDDHNLRRIKRNSLNTSTYKCIQIYHPTKFGCSSFYRFWDLTETGFFFCLGIGNERPKINFEKMKNKLLEVFIFSIILKFLENSIQPFMKNSADKKGEN